MTIRYGFYTLYHDKEYRITRRDGYAKLISHDIEELKNGFTESDPYNGLRYFTKLIPPSEIEDVYEIATFAIYQGYEFPIIHETNSGSYVLVASSSMPVELLEKLEFQQVDKGVFQKKIKKDEVDLVYEKKRTDYRLLRLNLRPPEKCFFRRPYGLCNQFMKRIRKSGVGLPELCLCQSVGRGKRQIFGI